MATIQIQDKYRAVNSTVFAAFMAGVYVSTFYVLNNLTMLSTASVLLMVIVLTVPITAVVLLSNLTLSFIRRDSYAGFLSMFICGLYLLLTLRAPVFESQIGREIREQLHGGSWLVAHILYFLVPAALVGIIFRRNAGKLAVILIVMTTGAVLLSVVAAIKNSATQADIPGSGVEQKLLNINLKYKPNIYLIVPDGFASFAYMNDNGIDVSSFKEQLVGNKFRLYNDTFSNYHATTASMLSMLDMRHHYYALSYKFSEVSQSARRTIGGENNLVRLLKLNGYQTQYVHQGDYLLLHGCTADYCFPSADPFSGARSVFRELMPNMMLGRRKWQKQPLGTIREKIVERTAAGRKSVMPQFLYIHIYEPGHAANSGMSTCDEAVEHEKYSHRVAKAIIDIDSIVDEIVQFDPSAVVVISGDHGPLISNKCQRDIDLSTPDEYRDRMSAVTAIRWPDDYHGQYDLQIKTNVNLLRYILASMADDSAEILGTIVPEDVYIRGTKDILKIIGGGHMLIPPVAYSKAEIEELNRENPAD